MDYQDSSNKRFKSANGAPVNISSGPANLAAYLPPPPIGARGVPSPISPASSASIDRSASGNKLRLTVKAPPSKLRQATSSSQQAPIPPNPYADAPSESDATPAPPAGRAARSTRNTKTVVDPDSEEGEEDDEEDAEGEEEDEDMEDAEGDVDQELLAHEDSEEDAEGEDDDMDELQGHPPPPIIKQTGHPSKPNIAVTAPPEGPLKSVEAKELEGEDDDDDEELSELDDNDEQLENEEGEGEGEGDEEEDSDASDLDNSRSATPDLSKLTRRQRGVYEEVEDGSLMALSNEAQKKKHLTAEEHAMRRAEMARRRKNLSEKRNEEEKMDTINKLLKKPAPKRRTRAEIIADQQREALAGNWTPGPDDGEEGGERVRPADPLFTRWICGTRGTALGVPGEWLEASVGEVFGGGVKGGKTGAGGGGGGPVRGWSGRMVEEVA